MKTYYANTGEVLNGSELIETMTRHWTKNQRALNEAIKNDIDIPEQPPRFQLGLSGWVHKTGYYICYECKDIYHIVITHPQGNKDFATNWNTLFPVHCLDCEDKKHKEMIQRATFEQHDLPFPIIGV